MANSPGVSEQLECTMQAAREAVAWMDEIEAQCKACSYCGTTGPLSQVSFAYCGGCRDSRVAREDRPRYCSEACQRAHWAAGHKDECPCAKDL